MGTQIDVYIKRYLLIHVSYIGTSSIVIIVDEKRDVGSSNNGASSSSTISVSGDGPSICFLSEGCSPTRDNVNVSGLLLDIRTKRSCCMKAADF